MTKTNKWSSAFWTDLGERVGATFVGALLALITTASTTPVQWDNPAYFWPILGVPTLVSLLKGLLANLSNPVSGASLVPPPEGPDIRNDAGAALLGAIGLGLLVLGVILLFTTLLKVFVVAWAVIIASIVIGLVLMALDGGVGRRV